MKSSEGIASLIRFGRFTVDVRARECRCGSSRVDMTARQFDVLVCLASRAGSVVSKETLLAEVWAGIPVEENTLAQAVSALRRQLRATSGTDDSIITVPGKGYQLALPSTPETLPIANNTAVSYSRRSIAAAAGAVLVLAAVVLGMHRVIPIHALHVGEDRWCAVLPFQTFGGSPLSGAALAEALTGKLASTDRARIRPTFASVAASIDVGIHALGARLKVDRIVSGSVRAQAGGGARIQVEL